MKSSAVGEITSQVEVLNISKHGFWLFVNQQEYFMPFEHFPWFRNASIAKILNVKLMHQHHLYWPELDIDLELGAIKSPEKYPLIYVDRASSPSTENSSGFLSHGKYQGQNPSTEADFRIAEWHLNDGDFDGQ